MEFPVLKTIDPDGFNDEFPVLISRLPELILFDDGVDKLTLPAVWCLDAVVENAIADEISTDPPRLFPCPAEI